MSVSNKHLNKIIWFLIGNPIFTASSRIHGMAVHRELLRLGYNSHIAYLPEFIEDEIPFDFSRQRAFERLIERGDLIVLQKVKSPNNLKVINYFKQLGLRVVLIDCDLPIAEEAGKAVELIICSSKSLRDQYLKKGLKASFIEDSPELYFNSPVKRKRETLDCFWFGDNTPQKWMEVARLENLLNDAHLVKWKLVTISNHPDATQQWSPNFLESLKLADVIALPIATDSDESKVKSANRLLQSMALSVPVISSPLPSYNDIVSSGTDGIICSTDEEWIAAFRKLEDDTAREQIGKAALATARKFSIDKTIEHWIKELGLNETFQRNDPVESNQIRLKLNDFFYRELLKKNLYYWKKMRFSLSNFRWLCYCVAMKLKSRLSI